jgi:selenocysteine lyase/cysteine desulfurase
VHRGTGFKSQLSTHVYEEARRKVVGFVGGDEQTHTCIFGKNTTEMVNLLARRAPVSAEKNIILVSLMEHHSNDLPWRRVGEVIHVGVLPDGRLDEADYDRLLALHRGKVALAAITGASNVTGYINPIHRLAEKAHAAGAQFAADCAQLAPHRPIRMGRLDEPDHLDYVVLSAHKMYAPFGTGALVGRRDTFEQGEPDYRGGGQVEFVGVDSVQWSGTPERDEAGSPNTIGAVALAAAITQLEAVGMDQVAQHEAELTAYALPRLAEVPDLVVLGDPSPARAADRVGVIPMYLKHMSHFKAAAILGYEFGIGVRNGCFCAHPYMLHLLNVTGSQAQAVRTSILEDDRRDVPGLVRASFGLYNRYEDIDALVEALGKVQRGDYKGDYVQDMRSGEFHPQGWNCRYEDYFQF